MKSNIRAYWALLLMPRNKPEVWILAASLTLQAFANKDECVPALFFLESVEIFPLSSHLSRFLSYYLSSATSPFFFLPEEINELFLVFKEINNWNDNDF